MKDRTLSILFENPEWLPPITTALEEVGVDYETWDLRGGSVVLDDSPGNQIFLNKVSASAHSRGNRHAPSVAQSLISHLESNGHKVLNGSSALMSIPTTIRRQSKRRNYLVPDDWLN